MNNTLSIKQIFQRFPSLYFERKGDTDDRKFIPTYFLLNFLFQQTGSYQNYIWTMRKNRPPFFFFICFPLYSSIILQRGSRSLKCIRTFYEKQTCLGRVTYCALTTCLIILEIRFMLYRLISYHGSSVKNRRGLLLLFEIRRSSHRTLVNGSINYFFGMLKKKITLVY